MEFRVACCNAEALSVTCSTFAFKYTVVFQHINLGHTQKFQALPVWMSQDKYYDYLSALCSKAFAAKVCCT